MKFRTRFMLLISIVVLISVIAVSVSGTIFSVRDMRRSSEERLSGISVDLGENIETWMEDKGKLLLTGGQVLADKSQK